MAMKSEVKEANKILIDKKKEMVSKVEHVKRQDEESWRRTPRSS